MVVRYLTGDPPELAEQAARVIDGVETLRITDGSIGDRQSRPLDIKATGVRGLKQTASGT